MTDAIIFLGYVLIVGHPLFVSAKRRLKGHEDE